MDKKKALRKLMSLDNEKADAFLVKEAQAILATITNSTNNDEIFDKLDQLEEFVYKVPDIALQIINIIVKNPTPFSAPIHTTQFGEFEGKTHISLLLKCIDILSKLRYIKPNEVFDTLLSLLSNDNNEVTSKIKESIKRQAQYDLHALKAIGYSMQRNLLDTVSGWDTETTFKNFEVIQVIAGELLEPFFEGTSMTDEKTLTLQTGSLQPTDFLKKIRRDTTELLYKLYKAASDTIIQLKLLHLLDNVARTPHVAYGDDVAEMIKKDVEYLVSIYSEILFPNNNLNGNFGIVKDIDHRLVWLHKNYESKIPKIKELWQKIRQDEAYSLFRLFVGDIMDYRDTDDWQTAEKERKEEIEKQLSSITEKNVGEWEARFNDMAKYGDIIDDWKFRDLATALENLSQTKPEIAEAMLDNGFKNNTKLKENFLVSFLAGLRKGNHVKIWDKFVKTISLNKSVETVSSIGYSVQHAKMEDVRKEDLAILQNIAEGKSEFAFSTSFDGSTNKFQHALINALYFAYRSSPKAIESLIIGLFKKSPTYFNLYIHELDFALHRGVINFDNWDPKNLQVLIEKFIELPDLQYHDQDTLVRLGKINFDYITQVFLGRINKDEKRKEKKRKINLIGEDRYDAIPYHINPDLQQLMAANENYPSFIRSSIEKMTTKWSIFNWEVSRLLRRVGGPLNDVLVDIIRKGKKNDLTKIARMLNSTESPDFEICFEIVKQTDDKKILDQVEAALFATGVVSGEFGLSEAHKRKAEEAKKYLNDTNPRAKKYAKRLVEHFTETAKRERQEEEEEIKRRKLEFEG